jgi:hypothetical protein
VLSALLLTIALAHPLDVLEEWELLPGAPLLESVTARAVYRRDEGPVAQLPDAVQGATAPEVFAVGVRENLVPRRGRAGWEVALPPGERETVRFVARVVRPVRDVRLFRLAWPATGASRVPARRVATLPRAWITHAPREWTCPDDVAEEVICVSSARAPAPLRLRVPAPPASRLAVVLAVIAVLAAGALVALLGPAGSRRERLAGALGGGFVGAALALGLVGAHAMNPALAIALAGSVAVGVGALTPRTPSSERAGGLALVVVPLVVVLDGRLRDVLVASAAMGALTALAALVGTRDQPSDAAPPPML